MRARRLLLMTAALFLETLDCSPTAVRGRRGVPVTGNGAASDQKKSTNVTIEDEKLTIDLHQEFASPL